MSGVIDINDVLVTFKTFTDL